MILIDFNGVSLAAILYDYQGGFDENLSRHTILNCIASHRQRFYSEFSEVVLCADAGGSWRREKYPYYKASRRKDDPNSAIDWKRLFEILGKVSDELVAVFPYKFVKVQRAEADDSIAVLAKSLPGPHVIVSNDKDFGQLVSENVKQYSPAKKSFINIDDAELYLKEMVIRGDKVDGVPNILSDDDTFVTPGKRQKNISSKNMPSWLGSPLESFADPDKIERNRNMIDFSRIPNDVQESILDNFNNQTVASRQHILSYLSKHGLRRHIQQIEKF